jgi:hypothetical protein
MNSLNVSGFTAESALALADRFYQTVGKNGHFRDSGKVVTQLSVDLGCRAFDVCHTNCCTLSINYVGPYHLPVVTNSCSTKYTCASGGIF